MSDRAAARQLSSTFPVRMRAAEIAQAVYPNLTARVGQFVNRFVMPAPGTQPSANEVRHGHESRLMATMLRWKTGLVDEAAVASNEGCTRQPVDGAQRSRKLPAWNCASFANFCAVAEELSFARAARRLFIAQPALSIQIRNLETELKITLLRRTTRSVEMTHAGRTFYAEARDILSRLDAAGKHAQDAAHGIVGTLRVAILPNVATADLGGRCREFRTRFPQVNLTLMEAPTHAQIAMLRRGDIDVGFVRISRLADGNGRAKRTSGVPEFAAGVGMSSEELAREEIGREPMIVAIPAQSELARKKGVLRWQDFHQQPMIGTPDTRERYFEPFFTCCERARVRPIVSQYAQELMTRLWMVACGFGFTPTSSASQEISRPGLAYRPLPPDGPEVLTFAAWRRKDQSPHLLHFIETLKTPLPTAFD